MRKEVNTYENFWIDRANEKKWKPHEWHISEGTIDREKFFRSKRGTEGSKVRRMHWFHAFLSTIVHDNKRDFYIIELKN